MSQYVIIHYGPYEAFHTTSYKPEKLKGVRDKLRRLGYRVDLNPVQFVDYCVLELDGFQVFRCNIRNLQLNREADNDPVAKRAVQACVAATEQLQRARCHFWLRALIDNAVFQRTTYQDQWPFNVDIKPYASCLDCVSCCGVLTKKKSDAPKEKDLLYNEIKQDLLYELAGKRGPKDNV